MNVNLTKKIKEKICNINKIQSKICAIKNVAQVPVRTKETSIKRKKVTLPHQDSPRKVKQKVTVKGNVNKKPSPPPHKKKNIWIPQIKKKTRYSTRARKAKESYNWSDDISQFMASSNTRISEYGFMYRKIKSNENIQFCELNIDPELLTCLKNDMDRDSKGRSRNWVSNENVKYKRVGSTFHVRKGMRTKEKEKYQSLIDVFNNTLTSALFCEDKTQMNYRYSWMESKGKYVQSPHVDFT